MTKLSKYSLSLTTLAVAAVPVISASCSTDNSWKFTLGVSDSPLASAKNTAKLNATAAPIIDEKLKDLAGYTNSSFDIVANMETAADNVVSGKSRGAFVSPQVMRNRQRDLDVAFFSSRTPMYLDEARTATDTDFNSTTAAEKVMANINRFYQGILNNTITNFKSFDVYDQNPANPVFYYRSQLYIDNPAAKTAWNAKDIKAFMATGVIVKRTSSDSGYITPEKMIQEHFNLPTFKFTDDDYKSSMLFEGSMTSLKEVKYGAYFSYAGERLQKPEADVIKEIKGYPGLECLAISGPIVNDGFVVPKGSTELLKTSYLNAFIEVVKTPGNMLNVLYFHAGYIPPTTERLQALYGQK